MKNFQVDGYGINADHYKGWKEADFVKDVVPGLPDKIGDDKAKVEWAKKAHAAVQAVFAPVKEEKKAE